MCTYTVKSLISSILLNNANTSSSDICSVSMLSTTGVSYPYYGNTHVAMVMCLYHTNRTKLMSNSMEQVFNIILSLNHMIIIRNIKIALLLQ